MGANGSYSPAIGGVAENNRTHLDTNMRIDVHKVLLQKSNTTQAKNIIYSNSDSPIYLIGKQNNDGSVSIHSVNIFNGHKLSIEINIKTEPKGNLIPYNGTDAGTHCHYWEEAESGIMKRKSEFQNPHKPISLEYNSLLNDIEQFNLKRRKYHGK